MVQQVDVIRECVEASLSELNSRLARWLRIGGTFQVGGGIATGGVALGLVAPHGEPIPEPTLQELESERNSLAERTARMGLYVARLERTQFPENLAKSVLSVREQQLAAMEVYLACLNARVAVLRAVDAQPGSPVLGVSMGGEA